MLDIIKKNKIIALGVLLALVGIGWYSFLGGGGEELLSSDEVDGSTEQSAAEREILNTLLELRAIELEGQIFSDPAFTSLRDFSTDIVAEPIGRNNPFAPFTANTGDDAEDEEDGQEGDDGTQ